MRSGDVKRGRRGKEAVGAVLCVDVGCMRETPQTCKYGIVWDAWGYSTKAGCIGLSALTGAVKLLNKFAKTASRHLQPECDIASLFMVSVYCFVTKACVRRPGAAASVERRRRERRTLLAGAAGELAGATRLQQTRPWSACKFSACNPRLQRRYPFSRRPATPRMM